MNAAAGRLESLLARHARAATAVQALYPSMSIWFDATGDAAVAYADTGRAWVAAGPPLAPPAAQVATVRAFVAAAAAAGRRACLFGVDARLLLRAGLQALPIGKLAWWHASAWPQVLRQTRSLREQLRRARKKGVVVRQPGAAETAPGSALRHAAAQLIGRWQAMHHLAPMQFVVQVEPFCGGALRQLFVAEHQGRLVGLLALGRLQRQSWSATEFLRDPRAPNGTIELLFDAAQRWVSERGDGRLTLGLLPLAGTLPPWLMRLRRLGGLLFDFRGLQGFKQKLRPQRWQTLWLGFAPERSAIAALHDVLRAFAGGPLWRFGLRTALRAPPLLLRAFALLLLPWTALLALAPTPWFPSAATQLSWVAFDLLLAAGYVALARRWRQWLGGAMATLLSLDAVLTAVQVALHSWPRERTVAARALFVVATLGPLLAAVTLWGGVHRRLGLRLPAPPLAEPPA